jgi:hypothetical protein
LVDVIGRYSKSRYPEKTTEELTHLIALSREGCVVKEGQPELHVGDLKRRLGPAKVDELVAENESGQTTPQQMAIYNIGKTGVLALLASRAAVIRHQPITQRKLDEAIRRYEIGVSLATLAKQLGVPRETIRRGLISAGVAMRQRDRQSTEH